MGLEVRGDRVYFYRKVRDGDRVVSEYGGSGLVAAAMALFAWEDRGEAAALRRQAAEKRHAHEWADREPYRRAETCCDALAVAASALMRASGYHAHKGTWRKRRGAGMDGLQETSIELLGRAVKKTGLLSLGSKAFDGDAEALKELRAVLKDDPQSFVAMGVGDVALHVMEILAEKVSGEKVGTLQGAAVLVKAAMVRDELAGPNPTAVERLLAERVAICWLEVYGLDLRARDQLGRLAAQSLDRLRSRAHNRYLAALRSLAAVRRVDLTHVANFELNIGVPDRVPVEAPGE